jgi:hypothetical protein
VAGAFERATLHGAEPNQAAQQKDDDEDFPLFHDVEYSQVFTATD